MNLTLSQYRSAHHIGQTNLAPAIERWSHGATAAGLREDAAIFAAALAFQRRWSQRILRDFECRGGRSFRVKTRGGLLRPQV
jgi:hypothetical protein